MKKVDKSYVVGCEKLKTSEKKFCNKCKYINDIGACIDFRRCNNMLLISKAYKGCKK